MLLWSTCKSIPQLWNLSSTNGLWNCPFYGRCRKKYFTNPKFVFTVRLDFFFGRVFDNQEEEKISKNCLFLAFLQPFWKRTTKNSTSAKTHETVFPWLYGTGGTADKIELCLRYLGQDAGTVVVLCLGPYRRYHYGYMETRLKQKEWEQLLITLKQSLLVKVSHQVYDRFPSK